jgi:hypothetical protein
MGYRQFLLIAFIQISILANAQLYVLKDQRPDTSKYNCILHKDLPVLCDTFHKAMVQLDFENLKSFVPDVKFLKETFDTLDIDFRNDQVLYRQQMILRGLQRDHRKILKTIAKLDINLKKLIRTELDYDYGKDEKGNQYCYVTQYYQRRKHNYSMSFIAIKLNNYWFVGDDLKFGVIK